MNQKPDNQTSKNDFPEIDEFLKAFKSGSESVIAGLKNSVDKAAAELLKKEKDKRQYLEKSLAKQKVDDELRLLEKISASYQKERDADLKNAQALLGLRKKQIEHELKAAAFLDPKSPEAKKAKAEAEKSKKAADKAEQDQKRKKDREDEKARNKQAADNLRFSAAFSNAFSAFRKEVDGGFGNSLKKTSSENLLKAMQGVGKAINQSLNAINSAIDRYASYQTSINTRLQGSVASNFNNVTKSLSDIAFSPLLKAENLYSNLNDIVSEGIASNVEQKALLQTVKDGIATTFSVTDTNLKRMIRVQQTDSTAARLGMEAYLTRFLNTYVENTEYLTSTFDNVASSLFEASAMLGASAGVNGAAQSAQFEYVVQKWLGTLSGVGLSDEASNSIARAIGQLGSGDVEGLSGSAMQNLLVMAASRTNLNYSKMLNEGINATDANTLMYGLVDYLKDIASTGTNVVKNQLAKVFGVSVSDLIAVKNLSDADIATVSRDLLSYEEMYGELGKQMNQLKDRIGISNLLNNAFSNLSFQTGMNIASSPALFGLWKITDLIQGVTGGINIPTITALGSGVDLETTLENLMKTAIVGVSTLGSIGGLINAAQSVQDGSVLLDAVKIGMANSKVRTFGGSLLDRNGNRLAGSDTSENVYIGQTDSDSYAGAALNKARDEAQEEVDVRNEEAQDPMIKYLEELDFKNGFDSIVENVSLIVQKIPSAPMFSDISGLT